MREYLTPLIQFQRFFLPSLVLFVLWASWRTVWKRDLPVGLGLYLGVVIMVDGYFNTALFLPGLEHGSIRYSEVVAAFLLIGRPAQPSRSSGYGLISLFVGLYFAFLAVSALRTPQPIASVFEFRMLIVPQIVAFLIARRGLHSNDDYRRLFACMTVLSLMLASFTFFDLFFDRFLLHSDMLSTPEYFVNRANGRYGSYFLNPNYLGAFVVLTFPAAFGWTVNEKGRLKAFGAIGLLSLTFCLVETQSRGPLLAFGIVVMLLLIGPAGEFSRWRRIRLFLPFVLVLLIFMPGFLEHAGSRFGAIDEEMTTEAGRTRQTVWMFTKRAIADHPLTGIGFGERQFLKVINEDYGFTDTYGESSLDNPHNSYLQMTVYAGYPALLSFLAANLLLLLSVTRVLLQKATNSPAITFGLGVGLAGFLAAIYPDMHMFTRSLAPVYWVYFSLLLSLATAREQAAVAVVGHEDSGAHFGDASQHLAGQSASWTS